MQHTTVIIDNSKYANDDAPLMLCSHPYGEFRIKSCALLFEPKVLYLHLMNSYLTHFYSTNY